MRKVTAFDNMPKCVARFLQLNAGWDPLTGLKVEVYKCVALREFDRKLKEEGLSVDHLQDKSEHKHYLVGYDTTSRVNTRVILLSTPPKFAVLYYIQVSHKHMKQLRREAFRRKSLRERIT